MGKFNFFIIILCAVPIISINTRQHQNVMLPNSCITPLGEAGLCVSLRFCPQVVNLFTQLPQHRAKQYSTALQNICGNMVTADNYPVVCCSRVVMSVNDDRNDVTTESNTSQTITTTTTSTTTSSATTVSEPSLTDLISSFESNATDSKPETNDERSTEKSNTPCQSPTLENGICMPLQNCTDLLEYLRNNPTNETFKTYLRSSNVNCGRKGTIVCCPRDSTKPRSSNMNDDSVPRRLPTEDEGCGFVKNFSPKVVGGEDSQMGAWPWIALIGYNAYSLTPFKCGGTLVTVRHVITAAHCLRSDLSFVRLGEYDLSTETETKHVDIDVARKVGHPNFGRDKRNDIAVLYLVRNVEISDLICPICMPVSDYLRTKSYINSSPYVAGWGRTIEGGAASNILKELQIPILENTVCRNSYAANQRLLSEQQFDNSVMCAGYLAGGRDTCQGDSGGPLMIPEPYKGIARYYLIGIVSYGIGCARIGIPGVYTNTQHFMDWITERIADT